METDSETFRPRLCPASRAGAGGRGHALEGVGDATSDGGAGVQREQPTGEGAHGVTWKAND